MIAQSFLAFFPSMASGFLLSLLLQRERNIFSLIFALFLSGGIGIGISSCLYFFWCLIWGPAKDGYFYVEYLLVFILGMTLFFQHINQKNPSQKNIFQRELSWTYSLPVVAIVLILVFLGISFKNISFMFPHGTFDAYGIWNLRARFIYRDMTNWQEAFSPHLNWKLHTDYPLLIPLSVVRGWKWLGEETTRIPIFQAWIFALSMAGLMFVGLAKLRSIYQAVLGVIVLIGLPTYTYYATMQTAEFPLAYYFLATIILILLFHDSKHQGYLILAGLTAGLAGWTKNEGLLFMAAVSLVVLLSGSRKICLKSQLLPFLFGLLLPAICISIFKYELASPNDLLSGQTLQGIFFKLIDLKRHEMIISVFFDVITKLGEWRSFIPVLILFYLALCWQKRQFASGIVPVVLILGMTFAGYYCVYLSTPHPLDWHLKYSSDRLFFHLTPSILFVTFYITLTPEQIFRIKSGNINNKPDYPIEHSMEEI